MQLDPFESSLETHLFDTVAIVAATQRRPATNLKPRSFASIKRELDTAHFLADTGFTINQFKAIHHALKIPNPV